jgi:hypothetical protein
MPHRLARSPILGALLVLLFPGGCGDDASEAAGSGGGLDGTSASATVVTSSAGPGTSAAGVGGDGSGGTPSGGGGDSATSGVGGGAGGSDVDCSGDWTELPETMLTFAEDVTPGSVAVSRGELELHLVLTSVGEKRGTIVRSVRESTLDPFPPPVAATDLDQLCSADRVPFLDVSEDGLRAYVTCNGVDDDGTSRCPREGCDILLATRANPLSSFELTGITGRAGFHPSVRADELEVVSNGLSLAAGVLPLVATRPSIEVDFGPAQVIEVANDGLTTISGSTISPDGLELYAYSRTSQGDAGLGRARRAAPGEPFGELVPIALWVVQGSVAVGAPDLTPDCRAMYVVRVAEESGIDRLRR